VGETPGKKEPPTIPALKGPTIHGSTPLGLASVWWVHLPQVKTCGYSRLGPLWGHRSKRISAHMGQRPRYRVPYHFRPRGGRM